MIDQNDGQTLSGLAMKVSSSLRFLVSGEGDVSARPMRQ